MKTFWARFKKWLLYLFLWQFLYVIILIWLLPPITITQLSHLFSLGLKRQYVSWENISVNVKLAALASEDQEFLDHWGVDWESLEKSLAPPKKRPHKKSKISWGGGASTISQQTAKNVFLWQGNGYLKYIRKVLEFFYTPLIELFWSKKRILEVYLNVIEMGSGIYGIEAAAQVYFKKSAKQLTAKEAAEIIASLPNPKKFKVNPPSRRVSWRYPQILVQMNFLKQDDKIWKFVNSL